MIPFSLSELAKRAQGVVCGKDALVKSISTSSKSVDHDSLFIPLKGERFDAHDFIGDAISHGATMIASSRDEINCPQDCAVLRCSDTLRLLGLSGQIVREHSKVLVGAITGSCGKTTVKEMTAAILANKGKTLFTEGNFNNDVGVPLTLLRLDQSFDYAIVEQGASHLQDIARTAEFVEADFALITNVGDAHIEGFGSSKGVYLGKSEILDSLFARYRNSADATKGIGIIPADSPWYEQWLSDYCHDKLLSFGESSQATMQVSHIVSEGTQLSFHLQSHDERFKCDVDITLNALGRHNAINAAGAALLAMCMGASEQDVQYGLSATKNMQGRLSPIEYAQGLTVIDDAYNASFNAVIAAIDTLASFKGKRIFIFGDMGELGDKEVELHQRVGEYAQDKIDLLLCIGPLSQYSVSAMGHNALHFLRHEDLISYLNSYLSSKLTSDTHITCLIKGSHAMHMDKVVNALKDFAS